MGEGSSITWERVRDRKQLFNDGRVKGKNEKSTDQKKIHLGWGVGLVIS